MKIFAQFNLNIIYAIITLGHYNNSKAYQNKSNNKRKRVEYLLREFSNQNNTIIKIIDL